MRIGLDLSGLRILKELSRRHWLYLPRLFPTRERLIVLGLVLVAFGSLLTLASRLYLRITVPEPDIGGLLREGVLEPPRFVNPLYATSDTDRSLVNIVFSKLITHDAEGNVVMDLAEGIEPSADGKAYTVKLKKGVRWHDGEPVTAGDVAFTIKAIQDPAYQSPLRPNWQGVLVEKLNDETVRFTLRQPYAPFVENLSLGIIPEHRWQNIPREAILLSDLNIKPVGSGPYRFKSLTRQQNGSITAYTLTRNPSFYRTGPYLKSIEFKVFAAGEDLPIAFRKNDISSFIAPPPRSGSKAGELGGTRHPLHPRQIVAVFLNGNTNPALIRRPVREALARAIDRNLLIAESLGGSGRAANSPLPAGSLGFEEGLAGFDGNPGEARRLLDQDGWKDENGDGVLERPEGSGKKRKTTELSIVLSTANVPEFTDAARLIREMWAAIGVRTELRVLPVQDLEASVIRPRAYHALLFGEVFGHDPDPFAFWHTSQLKDPGLNIALYSNRRVDQLLEEARRTIDRSKRADLYREFQKIVHDEIGAIFLYAPTKRYVVRDELRGLALARSALPEERFNQVNEWYVRTRRVLK